MKRFPFYVMGSEGSKARFIDYSYGYENTDCGNGQD